ncbi:MAG: PspC domain-containing protein [Bacteroidales bacterium]
MKKTLTVNINGIVFHIDEDAYNVLNDYLQSIRKNFSRTKGGEEIIFDIEARIAEMLKERIGDNRQVITLDDIEAVINVIGQPSEFGEEFAEEESGKSSYSERNTKRLYRDPEHSVLGGVCGGMGSYFNTDPVWFRVAFVLLCIPGIGTPLLVYAVLWIVLPEAKTAAERLEMKGEKVNISNIEKSIREEISNLKNKFNEFARDAKRTYKKKSNEQRSNIEGVGQALGKVAELFVKMILIFTGIILFILGISFLAAIVAVLFGFGQDIFIIDSELVFISLPAIANFFLGSVGNSLLFKPAFIVLITIPFLLIVYAGVKLVFGLDRTRFVGITALNIWLLALIITGFYSFKVFRSFSHTGVHQETVSVEVPVNNLIKLELKENEEFNRYYRYEEYFEVDEAHMIITNDADDFFYGIPQLEIVKSKSQKIELEFYYRARGKSSELAEERAERTSFKYVIDGDKIVFDQFFKLPEHEVWREQEVDIVIKLPVGCRVNVSENMFTIIDDFHHSPYRLSGTTWVMTDSGLEETEDVPLNIPEEMDENPVNQNEPKEIGDGSQVSVIGFLYDRFVGLFGYVT